jgi:hypothetical protein
MHSLPPAKLSAWRRLLASAYANEIHDTEECDQLSASTVFRSALGSVPWT